MRDNHKRKNNGNKKIEEIKEFIRNEDYTIHEHFKKRFEEREFTHKDVRRIIFDGTPVFTFPGYAGNRIKFDWKKHSVVVEFQDKPTSGKVIAITLLTIF